MRGNDYIISKMSMKSHVFWLIFVIITLLVDGYNLMTNNYKFDFVNCFFSILGIVVLIYQITLIHRDIKNNKLK